MIVRQPHVQLSLSTLGGLVVGHTHESNARVASQHEVLASDGTKTDAKAGLHFLDHDVLVC